MHMWHMERLCDYSPEDDRTNWTGYEVETEIITELFTLVAEDNNEYRTG